jgi:uncharacterized protein (TIGR02145 family)
MKSATIVVITTVCIAGCSHPRANEDEGIRVRTMTDARDEQLYPTMGAEGKLWLARNLDFTTPTSWCYNEAKMCAEYGRLYRWEEAKKVCPAAWHLPTKEEWLAMIEPSYGYVDLPTNTTIGDPKAAYESMTKGSFGALLGGARTPEGKYIDQAPMGGNGDGMYWTSSSCGADSASFIVFNSHSGRVMRDCDTAKGWALSVRCVKDVRKVTYTR